MSNLESDPGQAIALPTERHDSDNNAESVTTRAAVVSASEKKQVDSKDRRRIYIQQITVRMLNVFKEIGLMVLVAVTYAALTNDPPKVSKSPPAFPFFPKDSIVKDWYRGEISVAIEKARQFDIAFVMFYAPWDAESQEVRWHFELTARHMQKLVTFAAVNCWQPDSECRNQYNKVYNWPVLIAYPTHGRGIQYNGPKTVAYMIRFLNAVIAPLKRVGGLDVHYLRQSHDAVIVANVNALPGSLDYSIIYSTALRMLEKDPFQEVAFAVNTKTTKHRELHIYTWNGTFMYLDDEWKPETLLNWVFQNMQQVTMWLSPSGTKSQLLSNYIQPGPALIMFTPRNPLFHSNDYYDLLHEVGLEYHYCKNKTNSFAAYLLSLGIHKRRIDNCRKTKLPCLAKEAGEKSFPNVVTYAKSKLWVNDSFCASSHDKSDVCGDHDIIHQFESSFSRVHQNKGRAYDMYVEVLNERATEEKVWLQDEFIMDSYGSLFKTSMLTVSNDPRSPQNLVKVAKQNRCRLQNIGEKYCPQLFSESTVNEELHTNVNILGLACKNNRSMTLLAMDSLKYQHFAEVLGIDLHNHKDKTVAVILNEKMETHHVLNASVTDRSLREFIYKFTENNLSRALYTSSRKHNYTHSYTDNKDWPRNDKFSVIELYSETFLPTVMQNNKAVVVLYHSKQCAFCNGISYTFLAMAKSFSYVANIVFARIDGDLNSLPWEYTMETYPTILFFPSQRKSESRVFPHSIQITVQSLITFILSNLNPTLKLHAMWSLCGESNFEDDKRLCISSVRAESLSLINRTLKEWRTADGRTKAKILDKLRQLRNLHLLLAHSPKNTVAIQKYMKRLQLKQFNGDRKTATKVDDLLRVKDEL